MPTPTRYLQQWAKTTGAHNWSSPTTARRSSDLIMTGDTEDADLRHTHTDTLHVLYKPVKPAELRQILVQLSRAEASLHPSPD